MTDKCKEEIYVRNSRWPQWNRCSRDAVRDGYCTIHHPDYIAEKQKKQSDKWDRAAKLLKLDREIAAYYSAARLSRIEGLHDATAVFKAKRTLLEKQREGV